MSKDPKATAKKTTTKKPATKKTKTAVAKKAGTAKAVAPKKAPKAPKVLKKKRTLDPVSFQTLQGNIRSLSESLTLVASAPSGPYGPTNAVGKIEAALMLQVKALTDLTRELFDVTEEVTVTSSLFVPETPPQVSGNVDHSGFYTDARGTVAPPVSPTLPPPLPAAPPIVGSGAHS